MQYIWQHRLWPAGRLATVDGREVAVLDQGRLNTDAGPDFFNAKIRLDGEVWVGDVEIHVKASDWFRHHHDNDPAYNSVILHVVEKDDAEVCTPSTGAPIPQLRLPCNKDFARSYAALVDGAASELPCAKNIAQFSRLHIQDWLSALAYGRLIDKCSRVEEILRATVNNWEEACYVTLARALGTGTNGDAFQRLALSVPLRVVAKHADNLLAIESLLFGQAGFLDAGNGDNYYMQLKREYEFLSNKFGLKKPTDLNWKMARMRPANFPHRRIALLAAFLHRGFNLFSAILGAKSADEVRELFNVGLTGYWTEHFNFSPSTTTASGGKTSLTTLDSLVINVAVPMVYAFGTMHPDLSQSATYQDRAVTFLEQLKPEKNFITTMFEKAGIRCRDAFTSQALIQLRRSYCETRKCIYCRFGHRMLASIGTSPQTP